MSNQIDSDGVVGQNTLVIFQAGNSIILMPDFEVQGGGLFEVRIGPCDDP